MVNKVISAIEQYNMLSIGDTVIVGLSGGADSCALLLALCSLRDKMSLKVFACHVNHGLRGEEADRDEAFTRALCEKCSVGLFVLHADIRAEAAKRHIGTEQCGREVRYEFFERKAKELNAKIATAHTASDNAETVLFNLARGSGISGLCGIPPVRGNIIRPIIFAGREDTEEYCRRNGIEYVTDSSNLTREYNRNKLRLDAVPVMKEINPSFENAVSGLSKRLREAQDFIDISADKALSRAGVQGGYSSEKLSVLHEAVFSSAVRKLCSEFALIPESKHIELIRKIVYNGGAVELRNGIFAVSAQGIFRITEIKDEISYDECPFDVSQPCVINNKSFSLSVINTEEFNNRKKNDKNLFYNSLDYDTIPLSSVFRTRRSGDSFSPSRRKITKSVKKLFIEMKIPKEQRNDKILLASEGKALWIEDIGVCSECTVKETTKKVLVISRIS